MAMLFRSTTGFTLHELLFTLVIVGVVLALGLPNLGSFSADQRLTVAASDLQNAFKLARSEAIRSRGNVTVCASENSMSVDADCRGTWRDGFIVFADVDGNLVRVGADEKIIRAHPASAAGVQLLAVNDAHYFSFGAAGTGRGDVDGAIAVSQIVICDERGNAEAAAGESAGRLFVATPQGLTTTSRERSMVGDALRRIADGCS